MKTRQAMSGYNHLDVSEHDDVTIVRFKGRPLLVNDSVLAGIGNALGDLTDAPESCKLIVDFGGVEDVSSAMLGILVMLRNNMAVSRGQLVLCGLSPEVREFVYETTLSQLFEIRESAADAFSAFACNS